MVRALSLAKERLAVVLGRKLRAVSDCPVIRDLGFRVVAIGLGPRHRGRQEQQRKQERQHHAHVPADHRHPRTAAANASRRDRRGEQHHSSASTRDDQGRLGIGLGRRGKERRGSASHEQHREHHHHRHDQPIGCHGGLFAARRRLDQDCGGWPSIPIVARRWAASA